MLEYRSYLHDYPFSNEIISGDFNSLQLETADDFAAYRAMSQAEWAPILVSFSQKYKILDHVLKAVETHLDDDYDALLMTLRVPGAMRFPKRYYSDRLFLVADPEAERQHLMDRNKRVLVLQEGLVRHPMETGQNELFLTLHNPKPDAGPRFTGCCTDLDELGFKPEEVLAKAG